MGPKPWCRILLLSILVCILVYKASGQRRARSGRPSSSRGGNGNGNGRGNGKSNGRGKGAAKGRQLPSGKGTRRPEELGGRKGIDRIAHGTQLPTRGAKPAKADKPDKNMLPSPKRKSKRDLRVRITWTPSPKEAAGEPFKYIVQQQDRQSGEFRDVDEKPPGTHNAFINIPNERPSTHRYRVLVEDEDGNRTPHGEINELTLNEDGSNGLNKIGKEWPPGGAEDDTKPKKSNMRNPIELDTNPGDNDEADGVTYVAQVQTESGGWRDVKEVPPPADNLLFDSPYTCGEHVFRLVHRVEGQEDQLAGTWPEKRTMEPVECPEYTPLIKTRFTPTADSVKVDLGGPDADNELDDGEKLRIYKVNPDGSEELLKECTELPCELDGLTAGEETTVRAAKVLPDGSEKHVGPVWFPPKADVEQPVTDIISTQEPISDPEGIVRLCRRMRGIDRSECTKMKAKHLPHEWQRRPMEDVAYEYLPKDPRDDDASARPDRITTEVTPTGNSVTVDILDAQKPGGGNDTDKGKGGGGKGKTKGKYTVTDLSDPDAEPTTCDDLPCEIPLAPGVPHELLIESQPASGEPLGPMLLPADDHEGPVTDRVYWDPAAAGNGSMEVCIWYVDIGDECERIDGADGVHERQRDGKTPLKVDIESNPRAWLELLGPEGYEHSQARRMGVGPCEVDADDLNYEYFGPEHRLRVSIKPSIFELAPDSPTKPVKKVTMKFTLPELHYDGVPMSYMSYTGVSLRGEEAGNWKTLVAQPMDDIRPKANKSSLDGVYFESRITWSRDALDPSYPIRAKTPVLTGDVVQEIVRPRKVTPVPTTSVAKSDVPGYINVAFDRPDIDGTIIDYVIRTKTAVAETWETLHPLADDPTEPSFTVTVAVTDDSDPASLIVEVGATTFVVPKPNIQLPEAEEVQLDDAMIERRSSSITWSSYAVPMASHVLVGYVLRDADGAELERIVPPPSGARYNKNMNSLGSPDTTTVHALLQAKPKLDPSIFADVHTKDVPDFMQEYEVHRKEPAWVEKTAKLKRFVNNYMWTKPEIEGKLLYYILSKHVEEQLQPVAILPSNQFRYEMPLTRDERKEEYQLQYAYAATQGGAEVPDGCALQYDAPDAGGDTR